MRHEPYSDKALHLEPEAPATVRRRKRRKAAPPAEAQRPTITTKDDIPEPELK